MGHNYISHNYVGHNYMTWIHAETEKPVGESTMSPADDGAGSAPVYLRPPACSVGMIHVPSA